jgi:hypothetical protein
VDGERGGPDSLQELQVDFWIREEGLGGVIGRGS